ncbi:DUF397 domain-containing protein [Kitasatospora sp. NPDC056446]|uniref:DUF397 domain-containing protein n=1 Tax=Kitasatospora sp. NPDC056446 TaxID=3345819 RepID=UPI0036C3F5D9
MINAHWAGLHPGSEPAAPLATPRTCSSVDKTCRHVGGQAASARSSWAAPGCASQTSREVIPGGPAKWRKVRSGDARVIHARPPIPITCVGPSLLTSPQATTHPSASAEPSPHTWTTANSRGRCRARARTAPGRRGRERSDWQKSSYSSESVNCINLAEGPDRSIKLRESDDPDVIITTTPGRLRAFLRGVRAGEFDHLAG